MINNSGHTKIISVISGKGGTGKSLFTAVLGNCLAKEKCRVLLVDMDLHVRGLTILLSKYMGTGDSRMSVSKYLEALKSDSQDVINENNKKIKYDELAFFRFQECEFWPSVIDIVEPLGKDDLHNSIPTFLSNLRESIEGKYDILLLDCRAGLDNSVVQSVKESDFTISISEDDDVCLQANTNLVNYLRYKESINNIYTVINKGRRIKTISDIELKINSIFDFSCIGAIPFDERVMEDYGKDRFWLSVYDTLYFYGIVRFWKKFQEKTQLPYKIDEEKYNFGKSEDNNKKDNDTKDNKEYRKQVLFKSRTVLQIYGVILIIVGNFSPLLASVGEIQVRNLDLICAILSLLGILMLFASTSAFRRSLLGKEDDPQKLK